MTKFEGIRSPQGLKVRVVTDGKKRSLPLRLKWRDHSPTGFECGYGGSGPAQLALAMLGEIVPQAEALEWYQRFKSRVIAALPSDKSWVMNKEDVIRIFRMLTEESDFRISQFHEDGRISTVTLPPG